MISRFFIDRPIFASVLSILLTLVGGIAVGSLPISQYPPITPPTVQVACVYPGASARVVADTVAAPIEQQVNGVTGMIYMSSTSDNLGNYNLTVTFAPGTDLNGALVAVQNRVNLALPQLPEAVQAQGLTIKKKSPSILLTVAFFSPDRRYDDLYLSNYATVHVKDELFRLEGVGDIVYLGERDYSIRAWLDPQRLSARDMTATEVVTAIRQQNDAVSPGMLGRPPAVGSPPTQKPLDALGRLSTPEQFGEIVLKSVPGSTGTAPQLVRLRDVARVELGAQKYDQSAGYDGKPAVILAVFQLPGTNALDVADGIRRKMQELKARFPPGLEYEIGHDTTPYVRESVWDVVGTLRDAIILVGIVVLVFLQSWRATLIPLAAVPVAIVGTFAVLAALGFSLNTLSLFGLVLAIGIVVDDAIVVVENVERWLAEGLPPREAARKAMDEVTGPVVAVALVLCAVFVPCAFISGVTGQFFRQFAVTIAVSTVFSAINSLTLSPALAAILLKPHVHGGPRPHVLPRPAVAVLAGVVAGVLMARLGPAWGWWGYGGAGLAGAGVGWFASPAVNVALGWGFGRFNAGFETGAGLYARAVGGLLRVSPLVLLVYVGLLGLTGYTFVKAPQGFIPQQDQGYLLVNIILPDSASVQRTQEVVHRIEQIALETPGVEHTVSVSGMSLLLTVYGSNYATIFVDLKPFEKRPGAALSGTAIQRALIERLHREVREASVSVFGAPPVPGLGTAGGFKVMVEDRGGLGPVYLQKFTDEFAAEGKKNRDIVALGTMYRSQTPQLFADIDREKVRSLGVSIKDVNDTLTTYVGSFYTNNFNVFGRYWQVNVMAEERFRDRGAGLGLMMMRNAKGEMVPLTTVLTLKETTGPGMVMRYNLFESAPVNGGALPWMSSGEVMDYLDGVADRVLPKTMKTEWTELSYLQQAEARDWRNQIVFPLAVVFVFLVLAALYESWTLPLAVILVVPMCLLSALVGVLLGRMAVNIYVQIGFVVLVGLASKNAILIVEFAKQLRSEGRPLAEATREACRLRLRPIIMTSLAFILGVVPLVVASGAGWEVRRALGVAVFSGMLGVTFFGVLLTPVFFFALGWLGGTPLLRMRAVRWTLSLLGGLAIGSAVAVMLAWLHVPAFVAWPLGVGLGLGTAAVVTVRRR